MRHYSFKELSFEQYKEVKVGVFGGSRPRILLKHKQTNQQFFLKTYRHNTREVWAEMLASRLGLEAGFNIQSVSLKKVSKRISEIFKDNYGDYLPDDWQPVGALVRHAFPRGHEILYGAQIIGTASQPVTLEKIEENIRSRYLDSEDILQDIADMVIFDAWIGNMDRHHENWAISQKNIATQLSLISLSKAQRQEIITRRKFTPLFDHGSSLLFELGEDKIDYYNKNRDVFEKSYILEKKYALLLSSDGEKKNIFEIIDEHMKANTKWAKRFRKSLEKIMCLDDLLIARMIHEMPTDGLLDYSEERKKLLYYSLRRRKEILCKIIRAGEASDEEI